MASASRRVPLIGFAGLITALYTAVVFSPLWVYAIAPRRPDDKSHFLPLYFSVAAVVTIVLSFAEQKLAMALIGRKPEDYVLQCRTNGSDCNVRATFFGTSPLNPEVWELPSTVAQTLGMATTFWSLYIVASEGTGMSSASDARTLTLGLWLFATLIIVYAVMQRYTTGIQGMLGVTIGSTLGYAWYELFSLMGVDGLPGLADYRCKR
jgi:hypothetical protein